MNRSNRRLKKKGSLAEKIAARFLETKGYKIIDKNYYIKGGEIDIIAKKDKVMIFVEVKARYLKDGFLIEKPEVSINRKKISKIKKTAQIYIQKKSLSPEAEYRFDAISIVIFNKKAKIKHIKYAF